MAQFTPKNLKEYQIKTIKQQTALRHSMLWIPPGLGKTAITLTSIAYLIKQKKLKRVLVVAPRLVISLVWRQEANKWSHLSHLKFSTVMGEAEDRLSALFFKNCDIYLINYDNLAWLDSMLQKYYLNKNIPLPFDGIVWDEITKMKNSTSNRFKAFKKYIGMTKWRTGLTGTPQPEGIADLFGQYYCVDDGERLGRAKTHFLSKCTYKIGFKVIPNEEGKLWVQERIKDITLALNAEDYIKMPKMITNDVFVELPPKLKPIYKLMEEELFFKFNDTNMPLKTKVSMINKALQFSNGCVYTTVGDPTQRLIIHDEKLEAVEAILEGLNGGSAILAYSFRTDAERIMQRFKEFNPINLSNTKGDSAVNKALEKFKIGECRLLIGHPASMGHGVDGLQHVCSTLIWYGLNWSSELYRQFNGRLQRQGQAMPVVCHRILTKGTFDLAQMKAVEEKTESEKGLKEAIDDYTRQR